MADRSMKRNDHGRPIWFTVRDATGPVDLSNATGVSLILKRKTGTATLVTITGTKGPNQTGIGMGRAYVAPSTGESSTAALYDAEVEVAWNDGSKETFPSVGYLEFEIVADLNNA